LNITGKKPKVSGYELFAVLSLSRLIDAVADFNIQNTFEEARLYSTLARLKQIIEFNCWFETRFDMEVRVWAVGLCG